MDAGVVSGLLQSHRIAQERCLGKKSCLAQSDNEQKASHRKRLRRRGAVCGVVAPPRCAPASPSSRLLASDPAALATPPTPFFSSLLVPLPVPVAPQNLVSGVPAGHRATVPRGRAPRRESTLGIMRLSQSDRLPPREHDGPGALGLFRQRDSPNQRR